MEIYRIEHKQTGDGMWYKQGGVYNPFIMTLTEGKSKHLPMEFDQRYSSDDLHWYSGCQSIELMQQWFSPLDAYELIENDYGLYKFESNQYIKEENQILFTKEGVRAKEEIQLADIWDILSIEKLAGKAVYNQSNYRRK